MANVLHRTTLDYRESVNTPDFPVAQWIIDPDLSAVAGVAHKYWKILIDAVLAMTQVERDAVDAAEVTARRDAAVATLIQVEGVQRAFMLIVLDELNLGALKINALLAAIGAATSLAGLKTAVSLIADYPALTEAKLRTAIRNRLGT